MNWKTIQVPLMLGMTLLVLASPAMANDPPEPQVQIALPQISTDIGESVIYDFSNSNVLRGRSFS